MESAPCRIFPKTCGIYETKITEAESIKASTAEDEYRMELLFALPFPNEFDPRNANVITANKSISIPPASICVNLINERPENNVTIHKITLALCIIIKYDAADETVEYIPLAHETAL